MHHFCRTDGLFYGYKSLEVVHEASIEGVRPTGELLLRHADGTLREYLFKEIEFVIAGK